MSPSGQRHAASPDGLLANALADALGVVPAWLAPVADVLDAIEGMAKDDTLTDADLAARVEDLAERLPELLGQLAIEDLAAVIEQAMGTATIQGAAQGLRERRGAKAAEDRGGGKEEK